jgi:hypothetical protein
VSLRSGRADPLNHADVLLPDDHIVDVHVDDFGRHWASALGDCRPIGYELRSCLADRWFRFHSLPESQRNAESEERYTEILDWHATVIADLRHALNSKNASGRERQHFHLSGQRFRFFSVLRAWSRTPLVLSLNLAISWLT